MLWNSIIGKKMGVAEKQDDLEQSFKSFNTIFIPLLSNARR
jgi:hypothetical protein